MSNGGWGGPALRVDVAVYVVIRRESVALEIERGTLMMLWGRVLERERERSLLLPAG